MALYDFFRINLPYGIVKNEKGFWVAFNREYMPLGWSEKSFNLHIADETTYSDLPIGAKYSGLKEAQLREIAGDESALQFDNSGAINRVFLYNDRTNPSSDSKYWDSYFEKIKKLSRFKKTSS